MAQLCLNLMLMRRGREEGLNSNPGAAKPLAPASAEGRASWERGRSEVLGGGIRMLLSWVGKGPRVSLTPIAPFVRESQ